LRSAIQRKGKERKKDYSFFLFLFSFFKKFLLKYSGEELSGKKKKRRTKNMSHVPPFLPPPLWNTNVPARLLGRCADPTTPTPTSPEGPGLGGGGGGGLKNGRCESGVAAAMTGDGHGR
jgi:hypothetical protein